jgi:hypothetical protein
VRIAPAGPNADFILDAEGRPVLNQNDLTEEERQAIIADFSHRHRGLDPQAILIGEHAGRTAVFTAVGSSAPPVSVTENLAGGDVARPWEPLDVDYPERGSVQVTEMGAALEPSVLREVLDNISSYEVVNGMLADLRRNAERGSLSNLTGREAAQSRVFTTALTTMFALAFGQGALAEAEEKRYKETMPNPADFASSAEFLDAQAVALDRVFRARLYGYSTQRYALWRRGGVSRDQIMQRANQASATPPPAPAAPNVSPEMAPLAGYGQRQ